MFSLPLIVTLLIATVVAFSITPLIIRWYTYNNWLEQPGEKTHAKQTHRTSVPRGGGLAIFMTILLLSIFSLTIDPFLIAILVGAGLIAVVGFLDDLYNIHPFWRLGAGLIAALIIVSSGISIEYVTNPAYGLNPGANAVINLEFPLISFPFFGATIAISMAQLLGLFFIIWNMNIVNWSKGVDGQLPGFVSMACIMIGILSYQFIDDPTQFNTARLSFIVAGAYLGYLYWNWYPQKSMPGYGGGALAGYFLAILSIISGAKLATTLMVLAIPTADAVFTVTRRIIAGKMPWWGDRGHLHHKLLDVLGWGRRRIALFYWLASGILGILALVLPTVGKLIVTMVTFGLVFSWLIWFKYKQQYGKTQS